MSTSKGIQRKELEEGSVIRNFRITASDGKHYNAQHDNFMAIIALGYTVNFECSVLLEEVVCRKSRHTTWRGAIEINADYRQTTRLVNLIV